MRTLAIGGEPGSGKSTLVRALVAELTKHEKPVRWEQGLLHGHRWERLRVVVLGFYDTDDMFPGTDRFSMSVAPHAAAFVKALSKAVGDSWCLVFEGDRLFGTSFLQACARSSELEALVLEAGIEAAVRRAGRKREVNPTWLKGRQSKVQGLVSTRQAKPRYHTKPEHTALLVSELVPWVTQGKLA